MTTRPVLLALGAATALVALTAGPASAAATVPLDPPELGVGSTTTAHVEGTTIVDGTARIAVPGAHVRLLGESGGDYVVESTRNDVVSSALILRVAPDGTTTQLGRGDYSASLLSSDGATVVVQHTRWNGDPHSKLRAYAVATGAKVATHRIDGYANVLDAYGARVVLGSFEPTAGTYVWDLTSDAFTRVSRRIGHAASLREDLLASFTKDPYENGDTVVSQLTEPGRRLWTSRSERVEAFSTDGSRMALVGILDDGIGPGAVRVRSTSGATVATYTAVRGGYFGEVAFDSPSTLLLDTHGPRRTALVACTDASCLRVGGLSRTIY